MSGKCKRTEGYFLLVPFLLPTSYFLLPNPNRLAKVMSGKCKRTEGDFLLVPFLLPTS